MWVDMIQWISIVLSWITMVLSWLNYRRSDRAFKQYRALYEKLYRDNYEKIIADFNSGD